MYVSEFAVHRDFGTVTTLLSIEVPFEFIQQSAFYNLKSLSTGSFSDSVRRRSSVLQWNLDVATQLVIASDEDGLRVHIKNHNKPASVTGRAKASRTNNHNILMKKSLLLVDHDGAHGKVLQEDQYQDSEKNHDHNKIMTNSVLVNIDHYQDTAKDHNDDDNTDQDNKIDGA
ncbi:hypothetical protein F8388_001343 [Cannabis sativa]|uniref:Uncharacterized protein n=1 Tax=Cannabis sativa TaxID=3483 RepID=A0A7J6DZL0_CANSA|nr:hypothetical protein F8388_001343 [Cannabis sativa]